MKASEDVTKGNTAAMREALDATMRFLGNLEIEPYSPIDEDVSELRQRIMDAIYAPPRNCDKMPDIDNLTMHDLAKSPCKSTLECASREELLALVRWLLAPAAERKGEGDGSK